MRRRITLNFLIVIPLCLALAIVAGPLLAAQGRGIGAGALPVELKGVKVKDVYVPSKGKPVGVIQTIIGHVVVSRENVREAYYGAPGDRLFEGDSIHTLKASRCRFKLDGEDVVTVAEDTRIGIRSFTEDRARGTKNSAFSMIKGKAMFYTLKLLRHREAGMTVETPTAVVGVRGTKFGTEVVPIQQITNVHFFEGTGNVVSTITGAVTTIGAGQTVTATPAGMGGLLPTPPAVGQQFKTETNVPAPPTGSSSGTAGGSTGSGSTGSGTSGGSTGGGDTGSGTAPATDTTGGGTGTKTSTIPDTSTVAQDQTTKTASSSGTTTSTPTDKYSDPGTNASGSRTGYVSGMLTNSTGSSLEEVFVSANRQDSDGNIWLKGNKNTSTDYLRAYGGGAFGSNPALKWAAFDSGTKKSGDLDLAISHTQLDSQPGTNFEWGYWTEPKAFTISSSSYLVDNRGYYLFGPNATSVEVAAFTGTAIPYSGKAYGTYWTSSGGVNMTGSFGCTLNFGASTTNQISAFEMIVSADVGNRASIVGASGTYGSDGCFQITGGVWSLRDAALVSVTPDKQMAYGSFYSKADYIGGAWGMYHTASNTGAAGIFEGAPLPTQWKGEFTAAPRAGVTALNSLEIWTSQSSPDPQNFAVGAAAQLAKDAAGTNWTEISANAWTTTVAKMTLVKAGAYSSSPTASISVSEIGHNEYMAWGSWTQSTSISVNIAGTPTDYAFTDKGYYVYGQVTSPMPTTGSGTYRGNAYGTLATIGSAGAAVDLTGTFSMTVDYVGGQVNNYTLSAKDSISAERVTITQSAAITLAGSHYDIPGASLTAKIDGTTGSGAVRGNFYGTDATRTGGNWVANTTNNSAGGIFVGTKQ